jgi:hypothetical protein
MEITTTVDRNHLILEITMLYYNNKRIISYLETDSGLWIYFHKDKDGNF